MTRPAMACLFWACNVLAASGKEGWYRSLDEGLAEAKRWQQPIFLVFRCER